MRTLEKPESNWRATASIIVAAAVAAGLVWTAFSGPVLRPHLSGLDTPYLASVLVNLSDLAVLGVLIAVSARLSPAETLRLSGLFEPLARPAIWAALLFAPAALIAFLAAPVATDLSGSDLFWRGLGFPVIEEIVYRGLAVGALIQLARWPWWSACLAPALVFGLVHLAQGEGAMEIAGIVAITGLGGLLFGWLFVRWDFNLWSPILLHAGLNSLWLVFALGETALGGWLGNGLRLGVVIGAVLLAVRMTKRPRLDLAAD